jgi:hypothetical protein
LGIKSFANNKKSVSPQGGAFFLLSEQEP